MAANSTATITIGTIRKERNQTNKRSRRKKNAFDLFFFNPIAFLGFTWLSYTIHPNPPNLPNHPTNRHTWGSVRMEKTIDVMTPPQSESAMANFQLHSSKVERFVKS